MNPNIPFIPFIVFRIVPMILLAIVVHLAGSAIYQRYTGLARAKAALLFWSLVIIGGVFTLHLRGCALNPDYPDPSQELTIHALSFFGLWILGAPFVVRLYRKWIGGHLTEAEKMPGIEGVRAWLGVGNLICATLIPVCAWQSFGYSPAGMLALTYGLVLAYPFLNTASASPQAAPTAPGEDLSREREKVLQLLEAGKINANESAELLNALAHSMSPPPKPAVQINPQRKLILLGAALLLVGFLMPWFTVNTGEEMNRMFSQVQQSVGSQMPEMAGNARGAFPQMSSTLNTTLRINGGDLAHGLGWWVLFLGIGAAVLPFFATMDSQMQKKISLTCLGAGAIILIYLLTNNLRFSSIGILFAFAGYAIEVVGTLQEDSVTQSRRAAAFANTRTA